MKKILIECCKECIYCAQYDNGSATCSHPQLYIEIDRGITQAVEVPTDGAIHPDCPLPDDLPESKGSETEAMLEMSRKGFVDQIQKEKGCRSCRFIYNDGQEPCNTCGDGDYKNWQPLPAVPQEKGEK
jgi:hypothetical protein